MDFELNEEHNNIREFAKKFVEREVAPYVKECDASHTPIPNLIEKCAKEGILGLSIPKKYGGLGTDYISLGIACEEFERVDTAARVILSVHVGLNNLTLSQWADEEQKQKYLVPQAKGEKIGAYGLTEPNAGSFVAGLETTAKKVDGGYVLNGEKMWISLANIADNFLIFGYTDKKNKKSAAFIVERSFKGVSTSAIKGKLGVRSGDTGSISLSDVFVPEENMLGEDGEGIKIALSALDKGRYTVASGAVGLIQACLDASLKYAQERRTFGKMIAEHQLIQQKLARMAADAEIGRLLYYKVGWLKNKGIRNTKEVSLAKWINCDAALNAANEAIQIYGAYGYSNEFPVERYFRNARGATIYEGTREIQQLIQAEYLIRSRENKPLRKVLPPYPFEDDNPNN